MDFLIDDHAMNGLHIGRARLHDGFKMSLGTRVLGFLKATETNVPLHRLFLPILQVKVIVVVSKEFREGRNGCEKQVKVGHFRRGKIRKGIR